MLGKLIGRKPAEKREIESISGAVARIGLSYHDSNETHPAPIVVVKLKGDPVIYRCEDRKCGLHVPLTKEGDSVHFQLVLGSKTTFVGATFRNLSLAEG